MIKNVDTDAWTMEFQKEIQPLLIHSGKHEVLLKSIVFDLITYWASNCLMTLKMTDEGR